ncbi:MAG: malto-oligosyltrehalose trehalohydrolase, partial [Verrucomicrobia bacterium]
MLTTKREIGRIQRRYPIGAELIGENETYFRVWAPKARHIDLVLEESRVKDSRPTFHPLEANEAGYFSGAVNAGAGARYWFRVNNAQNFYPDPASRFQPDGPHGSSCIVDPTEFQWTDSEWPGITLKGQIIYEMHI